MRRKLETISFEEWLAREMARAMRRELDTEIMATHTFYSNGVKFKMYLN